MKKISWLLLSLIAFGISTSCLKNEICSPYDIELNAGIYTLSEKDGVIDTIPFKIDIDSIYAITLESENLLINKIQADQLYFPLNNASNESIFVISVAGMKDTIQFNYEKHLLFNSVKCGVTNTYTITNFHTSAHFLKDIVLINPKIDVISTENIQFIF